MKPWGNFQGQHHYPITQSLWHSEMGARGAVTAVPKELDASATALATG